MSETSLEQVSQPESTAAQFDPERIMAELAETFDRVPEDAIRQAREHREVMIPRLVQAIEKATAKTRRGEKVEDNAHFFALFLLTEFGAREALPAILEAVSLPGEGPFDLFEDAITSNLAWILVKLSDDPLTLIDRLIHNKDLNEYVRWGTAQMYLHLVKGGRMIRAEAVERLRQHLRREMEAPEGSLIITELVDVLSSLAPADAYADIKEAFSRELVDESMIGMECVDRSIEADEAGVQQELDRLRVFDDTIEELRQWSSFQPETLEDPESTYSPIPRWASEETTPLSPPPLDEWSNPPQLEPAAGKRAGRNDPCPCGSGKKYKKCCLDADLGR
jgi:hypothetical protein